MKFFYLILIVTLCSCGIQRSLDDMDGKMTKMGNSVADVDAQITQLGAALEAIVGMKPSPSPTDRTPAADYCYDLSTMTTQQLTALRDELKSSVSFKVVLNQSIPNTLALVKSLKICAPGTDVDSSRAALITEVQALILQL